MANKKGRSPKDAQRDSDAIRKKASERRIGNLEQKALKALLREQEEQEALKRAKATLARMNRLGKQKP